MIPVNLVDKNLGGRHRELNHAVNEYFKNNADFALIENTPEVSTIDRIFKIMLASKYRNIDYIIKNLQDDDMLYVSKTLKSKWMIEDKYEKIINPEYLENILYPTMITTAVTKMKHWIYINLKDAERCERFFLYYYNKCFKYAMKFIKYCSPNFIKEQFPIFMQKISPQDFKVLCEIQPMAAKIFFDATVTDQEITKLYLSDEKRFFDVLRFLLRSNTTLVLDITEKYFNKHFHNKFSSRATKFVIEHCHDRFSQKPELYTTMVLKFKALTSSVNSDDAKNLIMIMAREEPNKISYKMLEPLFKRLHPNDRGPMKKKIFVDKDIGTKKCWPYKMPYLPDVPNEISQTTIFVDEVFNPNDYIKPPIDFRAMLKKRKYAKWSTGKRTPRTLLDKLFNEYRVASFDKTLYELRKKLKAESCQVNRQYMMLVLVSKTGGHEVNIVSLLRLLALHKNEPSQVRATVVRSLIKRASIWRVADDTWHDFVEFAHGLGVDGKKSKSEADCVEGIHVAVIRQLLREHTCDPELFSLYLLHFTTFKEYPLTHSEKMLISDILPSVVYNNICNETNISMTPRLISYLLNILKTFGKSVESFPGLLNKIESLSRENSTMFSSILFELFNNKIARKTFFKPNFEIVQTEDSYLNALRHDIDVISPMKVVEILKKCSNLGLFKRFFKKVCIYFSEDGGLAKSFESIMKGEDNNKVFAKPLCIFLGQDLLRYMREIDNSVKEIKDKIFAAAIRANVHMARPKLNVDEFSWSKIGTKAIANKSLVCRNIEVRNYIEKLIENKQTIKLAYLLSQRTDSTLDCFIMYSKLKPNATLKLGLKIIKLDNKLLNLNTKIWNITKVLLENYKIPKDSKHCLRLPDVRDLPIQIQTEYVLCLYKLYRNKSFYESMPYLCHIANFLPNVDENFIDEVIMEFLNNDLPKQEFEPHEYDKCECRVLYLRIIIRFLFLCKTKDDQVRKLDEIASKLFDKLDSWLQIKEYRDYYNRYVNAIIGTLRYFKVFLDNEYVSCLPVMNKILDWIRNNYFIEKDFKIFVQLHLNMLYYKAIKSSMNLLPNKCIDINNEIEARKVVGSTFGRYWVDEVKTLKTTYFDSIQYLYNNVIKNLPRNFLHSGERYFTESLINSVLEASEGTNITLALYLCKALPHYAVPHKAISDNIKKTKNIEVQMMYLNCFSESL